MADNPHASDNPVVLADEILTHNGVATVADSAGRKPDAQIIKIAKGGDSVAQDIGDDDRLPVDPAAEGVWGYHAGPPIPVDLAGSSVTEAITGRVLSIDCLTGTAGGTVTINGGAVIPVPADVSWGMDIDGRLIDPTIALTGVVSYTIQYVQ